MSDDKQAEAIIAVPEMDPAIQQSEHNKSFSTAGVTGAMALMIVAMIFIPLMDVFSKILSTRLGVSPVTITFIRFAGQAVLLAVLILFSGSFDAFKSKNLGKNLLRGMLMGVAVCNFFIAIKYLPLADAIAIFFVEPLIVIFLSSVVLKEKVGWRRNLAALVGFGGALLIIQPTYSIFGAKAFLPLVTATLFAFYLVLSRKIGQSEHPYTMQFWAGIGGSLVCGLIFLLGSLSGLEDLAITIPDSGEAVLYLALVVIVATVCHMMILVAFSRAEASILAPFQYLEIVTMTAAGYFVFGDFPSPIKWLGIAIIVSSGLYIFMRERRPRTTV